MKFTSSFLALSYIALTYANPISHSALKGVAPLLSNIDAEEIPNGYIVVFKDHVKAEDAEAHQSWVATQHRNSLKKRWQLPLFNKENYDAITESITGLKHTFKLDSMLGYSGHFDEETIEAIRRHPDVSIHLRTLVQ